MKKVRILSLILSIILTITMMGCANSAVSDVATSNSTSSSVSDVTSKEEVKTETKDEKKEEKKEETKTEDKKAEETKAEEENLVLRDCVENTLGCRVGCAVTGSEIDDKKVWEIITTHFNAVTLGNELKPDALFNYSCTYVPGTKTVDFNGESMVVPTLNYSRANYILDKFLEWNAEHPDREIKIRGHVLVWHSQTPEWFFHEDYDKSKPYVDKDTMNKRLEWYIMTVLTYYTGEDSKYKDLFYGWDVVNEAISDATGSYRTDKENPSESLNEDRHGSNSSWWHVYNSNEYIINAFKYANKYAPESLELYYNDYNECVFNKRNGIATLLEAIKAEEGAPGVGTRITAMGMQGHYSMDTPDSSAIESSIKTYANIVGHVQLTEVDVSCSSSYDGTDATKDEENEKLKKRYNMIRFAIVSASSSPSVSFDGITFWGTVDHYSWLQSRSNVGGGSKTGLPQMPLLFGSDYEPKSCFYVFARTK